MTAAAFSDWFTTTGSALAGAMVSAGVIYFAVIFYARLVGIRSFAKMSGFDFAMTIATGSVIASVALNRSVALPVGLAVLGVLFFFQWLLARLRLHTRWVSPVIDNQPILVLREGQILEDNLRRSAITRDDLAAKLREANVLQMSHARAVIVETTGDVSVLHGNPDVVIDDELLLGVRDRSLHGSDGKPLEEARR